MHLKDIITSQRAFFDTHTTKEIPYRIKQLKKLKKALIDNEHAIINALQADLGKPALESYFSAIHMCIKEIDYILKHINSWSSEHKVSTPLTLWPMYSALKPQPYGVILIMGTWNYPFNLNILPLIGAIAAGNCAIIKPSSRAISSENTLVSIINNTFDNSYIYALAGGTDVEHTLLDYQWDYIFFTGSIPFAQKLMHNAAEHITPVSLELGGKSPCIIDDTAHIDMAAKKIAWGKWLNVGQNCISPDYILVHTRIKDAFIDALKRYITNFYSDNQQTSNTYGKLIDAAHAERLEKFMHNTRIIFGGTVDADNHYIAPTILEVDSLDHPIMQEEIFGPLLPIITFDSIDDALAVYTRNPHPLAVYLFSQDADTQHRIQKETASGAFGLNELVLHVASHYLPFGGIGKSGIGRYHGKSSFDTFSNYRAIIKRRFFDMPFRYPNYRRMQKWFRSLLQWL